MKNGLMKLVSTLLALVLLTGTGAYAEVKSDPQKLDAYYELVINYINNGDYERASTYLDHCLEYCDEDSNPVLYADILLKKGCVYVIQGDYDNGAAQLDEAIRVQPELADAYLVKTQIYTDWDQYAEAVEALNKYLGLRNDENEQQVYEPVLAQLNTLLEINAAASTEGETQGEVLFIQGQKKMEEGLFAFAARDFAACMDDPDHGAEASYNAGVCYLRVEPKDFSAAMAAFLKCQELGGTYNGLYYNLGVCEMALQNYEQAAEDFTASYEGESYKSDAVYNRAVCYMTLGKTEDGIQDFTAYLALLQEAVDTENAKRTTEANLNGTEPELLTAVDAATYYRGICYLSEGKYEEAIADFSACIECGEGTDDSRFNRGLAYLQSGYTDAAEADFDALIEKDYRTLEAKYYRSFVYRNQNNNEAALADLTACIEGGFELADSYYQRAQVYNAMGDSAHYYEDLEAYLSN